MNRYLLFIVLVLISITGFSQTYNSLPAGFVAYTTGTYKNPAGVVIMGTTAGKFRVITQQQVLDSLLALKVTLNPISPQSGNISLDNSSVFTIKNSAGSNSIQMHPGGGIVLNNGIGGTANVQAGGVISLGSSTGGVSITESNISGGAYSGNSQFTINPNVVFSQTGTGVYRALDSVGLGFYRGGSASQLLRFNNRVAGNKVIVMPEMVGKTRDTLATRNDITTNAVVDIAALNAYSGLSTTLLVQHPLRGGTFHLKTGLTADGGTVFEATGIGAGYYWQRDMSQSDGYHVNWFGAVPYSRNNYVSGDFDSKSAFQACIDARTNRNTPVVLDYGVYMISDSLRMGEGTRFIGKASLWPRQYFGDGSVYIDYTNMSAVRFYNTNNNGFTTTSETVSYRSQGIGFFKMGIFGAGRQYNKTGVVLHQTPNSTSPAKTTGLVTMEDVYFADWGTGADGKNSTDTWYSLRNHFADVKVGMVGGSGQTFLTNTDFFKIDSIGVVLNSISEPDEMSGGEIETRFAANAAIIVNGKALIHDTQFLTNKKSIVFSSTAKNSVVSANHFHINSDNDITVNSGATDIQINGNHFMGDYFSGGNYNYAFALENLNVNRNMISSTGSRVQINNNYFTKNNVLYVGNPVLIDGGSFTAIGNTFTSFTYTNEKQFVLTGGASANENYDLGSRTTAVNYHANGRISSGLNQGTFLSRITAIGETEDDAAISSVAYGGSAPTFTSRAAGGTAASPTNITTGANLGQWKSQGYYSGFVSRASIDFVAAENWGATNKGTGMNISVTPIGTNGRIPMVNITGKGTSFGVSTTRTASAYVDIEPGTAVAGTAPLKFRTGTLNTTPEAGAMEFNANRLYFTPTTTREQIIYASDLANYLFISVSSAAPTPTGTGTKGEVRYVSGYRYECIATNTWIRTSMDVTW